MLLIVIFIALPIWQKFSREEKVVKLRILFVIKVEFKVAKIKGRVLLKSRKIQFHDVSVRGR